MNILDHFKSVDEFSPETVEEYVVLQIARHLNDLRNLNWHLRLVRKYPLDEVVAAFHKINEAASEQGTVLDLNYSLCFKLTQQ
jgi:hypothetical protein